MFPNVEIETKWKLIIITIIVYQKLLSKHGNFTGDIKLSSLFLTSTPNQDKFVNKFVFDVEVILLIRYGSFLSHFWPSKTVILCSLTVLSNIGRDCIVIAK